MSKLITELKEKGLYTYTRWNVLFICPPLSITEDELSWGLNLIDEVLYLADDIVDKSSN
jgi:taurine--2-oxoglutarate transaminase